MNRGAITGFAVAAVVGAGMWYFAKPGHPAVFEDMQLDEAVARSQRERNWLVVKVTATWCPPCKTMDKTTFVDDRVVEWVKANGAAIAVDVDRARADAAGLGVRAVPTTVLFKNGREVGRVEGAVPPAMFVAWLQNGGE